MVFVAIYHEISSKESLMKKLARKQPSTLQGLMDKVEEFMNQEETLKAMASSRLARESSKNITLHLSMQGYQKSSWR